jgi:hypothetical protein
MRIKRKKLFIGLPTILHFLFAVCVSVFSQVASTADKPITEGEYSYKVENGKATLTSYFGHGSDFMMIPSTLGGYPVTTVGDGIQTAFSNNGARGVVLFPDTVTKISNRAIYDYNVTYFFSIPASVTKIEDGATSSIAIAALAGVEGSEAQRYAKQVGIGFSSDVVKLKAEVGAGGTMSNSGNYLIPKKLERSYNLTFDVKANRGYRIDNVLVDGVIVKEAKAQGFYSFKYALNANSSKDIAIKATFVADARATGVKEENPAEAAKRGVNTDEFPDNGATVGKYANAIGICGGKYYATTRNGKTVLYELVQTYASKDGSIRFRNQAEVKKYASEHGFTFGKDYDYIHVYNYKDPTDSGRSGMGGTGAGLAYYVAYLYKTYTGPISSVKSIVGDMETAKVDRNRYLNISSLFAQNKAEVTLKDWTFTSYSNYYGPTEGTNFYGADSSLLADSGAIMNLINPSVDGAANIAYATYKGRINITGGYLLGIQAGAHGPYVGYGGEIYVNAQDTADPGILARPTDDQGFITRDKKTQKITVTNKLGPKGTTIITTQPTGTALATDAGGGTLVANNVIAKTYGAGSGGVYSIGSNEGLVYVFNSILTSYMDAGFVSASGGYIYANNSVIQGLMGIKLRAGQNSTAKSEVRVKNSQVIAFYDADEMARVFDVSTLKEAAAFEASGTKMDTFSMNMFANSRTGGKLSETALNYWFEDGYTKVPGAGGGNMLAVIYTEGSKTPIFIDSSKLINKNYAKYKDAPGSKAKNLIISSEGNGIANVFFTNNNSKTKWDLTGKSSETTEVIGDFHIAEPGASSDGAMGPGGGMRGGGMPEGQGAPGGGMPGGRGMSGEGMPGGQSAPGGMGMPGAGMEMFQKGNYLNATFENSEWQGMVLGVTKNANLTFDAKSSWKATGDTDIDTLTVAAGTVISADKPVTVSYSKLVVSDKGDFKFGKNVTGKVKPAEENATK